jgi:hypothetical protein
MPKNKTGILSAVKNGFEFAECGLRGIGIPSVEAIAAVLLKIIAI